MGSCLNTVQDILLIRSKIWNFYDIFLAKEHLFYVRVIKTQNINDVKYQKTKKSPIFI
jgi:hypothetical protein